jgi:hypothetical protein
MERMARRRSRERHELFLKVWHGRVGESEKCSLCKGKETPWHIIRECPGERAVEIRTDWAKRMYVGTCAKRDHELESTTGRGECAEAKVEGGGRRSSRNVATGE